VGVKAINDCAKKLDFNYTNLVLKNQLESRYKLFSTSDLRFNVDSKCGGKRPGNHPKDVLISIGVSGEYG
jgi:hypothetical protein